MRNATQWHPLIRGLMFTTVLLVVIGAWLSMEAIIAWLSVGHRNVALLMDQKDNRRELRLRFGMQHGR